MSRANQERIYEAERLGLRNRLRDEWRISQELADTIVDEREVEAANRRLEPLDPRYRSEAVRWIERAVPQATNDQLMP
jgi:hypothetical protein